MVLGEPDRFPKWDASHCEEHTSAAGSLAESAVDTLPVLALARLGFPFEAPRFKEIQLNVHSFPHRLQFEQAANAFCRSFYSSQSASLVYDTKVNEQVHHSLVCPCGMGHNYEAAAGGSLPWFETGSLRYILSNQFQLCLLHYP